MLYYQPAIPHAYENMKDLKYVVSNGNFLRNMHRWSAIPNGNFCFPSHVKSIF